MSMYLYITHTYSHSDSHIQNTHTQAHAHTRTHIYMHKYTSTHSTHILNNDEGHYITTLSPTHIHRSTHTHIPCCSCSLSRFLYISLFLAAFYNSWTHGIYMHTCTYTHTPTDTQTHKHIGDWPRVLCDYRTFSFDYNSEPWLTKVHTEQEQHLHLAKVMKLPEMLCLVWSVSEKLKVLSVILVKCC